MRSVTARKARTAWVCCINTTSGNANIAMQKLNAPLTATETFDFQAGTREVPAKVAPASEPLLVPSNAAAATRTTPVQIVLLVLGVIAFLYFARPVVLPVFLACVVGMA